MIEITGDLFRPWTYSKQFTVKAICLTTNRCVDSSGNAIMGRGNAGEAKKLFPGIEVELGKAIKEGRDIGAIIRYNEKYGTRIISFPTKPGIS